jgi:hypothetical protein
MHRFTNAFRALPLLLLAAFAQAQTAGTVTFTANKTSSTTSFAPVLTWSTSPVASSCAASGAWSGTKFASGSQTLATITSSKSYTLTCAWGNGNATINWVAPTQNTDNSALTNLKGFKVVYGTSATNLNLSQSVSDPAARSMTIAALGSGTWYFAVRAVNTSNVESDNSTVVSRTISAATAAKTVNITISSTPTTTWKTISRRVYDVVIRDGVYAVGRQVGTAPLGTPCQTHYKVAADYYKVDASYVTRTLTPRSNTMIARCAKS